MTLEGRQLDHRTEIGVDRTAHTCVLDSSLTCLSECQPREEEEIGLT